MSIKLMTAVDELPRNTPTLQFTPAHKAVLHRIADFCSDDGACECWPSVATLERKTLFSRRTIQRAMTELEQSGFVMRTERPGRSNVYKLCISLLGLSGGGATLAQGVRHSDAPGGATLAQGVRHPGARSIREPLVDPSLNLTRGGLKPVIETVDKIRTGLEAGASR